MKAKKPKKAKIEEPKTEEPKTKEPKTEEPKTKEPKTEEPKTEEPKTEEPKTEEPKTEAKESKLRKLDDYSYFRIFLKVHKLVCFQVVTMLLIVLLYVNLYNDNVYDFLIYFCFGAVIAMLFISTLVLIKKLNITSSKKYTNKYSSSIMLNFCKKYLYLSEENTGVFIAIFDLSWHLFFSILAFIYAKRYIKSAKKTTNPAIISLVLFCAWLFCNIYINDAFKIYNKALEITRNESTTIIISVTLTYTGLLYYFDTIKNEVD